MTRVYGNSGNGGTSGITGGRLFVDYTYTQDVGAGTTTVTWKAGFDYGNPNYWHNLSAYDLDWTATVGSISSGTASESNAGYFYTSTPPNPGGDNPVPAGATNKSFVVTHSAGEATIRLQATVKCYNQTYTSSIDVTIELPDISTTSTADPPTDLSPSGVPQNAAADITFTWTHNPTDGTPQTKFQLQYDTDGGASYVTVGPTSTSTSSYTLPGGTVANGETITWRVATAGENGTLSDYSAVATFPTFAKPTVTITEPGSSYESGALTVEWTYAQAQSSPQVAWVARLYDDADTLLETISGTTELQGTFSTPLTDATTYTVTVQATSAAGLQSDEDEQEFTTDFISPGAITITSATYDEDTGSVVLELEGEAGYSALELDGTGDYATTADDSSLDITGDLDLRIDLRTDDWTPATKTGLIEKWDGAGNQRSYALALNTDGTLQFRISTDGEAGGIVEANSSTTPTPVDGRLSVRAARVGTTVTFYTSTDTDLSNATWTQLGTTQTVAGTIHAGTAALTVGSGNSGAALAGHVYSAQVRGAAGAVVAAPDWSAEEPETTSFEDSAGRTWTLQGDAAIVAAVADIATVDVQRKIGTGDWVTFATGIELDGSLEATVVDTAPTINGTNTYRAIAYSAVPSSVTSAEVQEVTAEASWSFLSAGSGFSDVVRMKARPSFATEAGVVVRRYRFAGRTKPVELSSTHTQQTVSVSGLLLDTSSTVEEWEEIGRTPGVKLWRTPEGRRLFLSVDRVRTSRGSKHIAEVSFTGEEIDYTE